MRRSPHGHWYVVAPWRPDAEPWELEIEDLLEEIHGKHGVPYRIRYVADPIALQPVPEVPVESTDTVYRELAAKGGGLSGRRRTTFDRDLRNTRGKVSPGSLLLVEVDGVLRWYEGPWYGWQTMTIQFLDALLRLGPPYVEDLVRTPATWAIPPEAVIDDAVRGADTPVEAELMRSLLRSGLLGAGEPHGRVRVGRRYVYRSGARSWDVRVWRWDGATLTQERVFDWPTSESVASGIDLMDTDGDGYTEIFLTGTIASGSGGFLGLLQIWEWDPNPLPGRFIKRAETTWGLATLTTEGHGLAVAELNDPPASPVEVVVGGFTTVVGGRREAQINVWPWDGTTLGTPSLTQWSATSGDAEVHSVFAGHVDPDTQREVVSAGMIWNAGQARDESELRIFRWTGTALSPELDPPHQWADESHSAANSVFAANVDTDSAIEIVVAGESSYGQSGTGQITTFSWDGSTLLEENRRSWTNSGLVRSIRAHGIFALDIEPDGVTEILTAGRSFDPVQGYRIAQLRIWSWNAGC